MAAIANAEVIKRLVILVADSKAYSRGLLRSMLFQLEIKKIHEVMDGAAAVDAIYEVNPDVVILDWDLPVISTRELLRMARSPGMLPNPNLPIIVLSNSGEVASVHEAIQLGAPQIMVWPISPKMLEQRLVGIVKKARKVARAYKHGDFASSAGSKTIPHPPGER